MSSLVPGRPGGREAGRRDLEKGEGGVPGPASRRPLLRSRRGQRQKGQRDGPWLGSDVDGGGAGSDAGNPGGLRAGSDSRILLRLVLGIFASQKSTLNDEIGLGEIAIC